MSETRRRTPVALSMWSLPTVLLLVLLYTHLSTETTTATIQVAGDSCFPAELNLTSLDGTNGFAINGEAQSDRSGISVAYAGDLNHDGIHDIIVGSYQADPDGISGAGTSYVVFGRNTAVSTSFPSELEVSSLGGSNGFAINGEANGDRSGVSVSYAGDLNGDSIDDIIIGAHYADPNGKSEAGTSFIVFGKNTTQSTSFSELDLSSLDGTNGFAINGEAADDRSGISVSYAGDVNGDNIDDIIIGARRASPNGKYEAGTSYVVFGRNTSESSFPSELELASLNGTNGFAINGEAEVDSSGRSVPYAGDVNGDNIDDIIIGAQYADSNGNDDAGKSYVVFGQSTSESINFPSELDLSSLDGTNGFAINGEASNDNSGLPVSYAGDVNGDNIDDIIIGASVADPNGKSSAGTSYVVFGKNTSESTSFPSELELSSLDGTIGFAINGEAEGDWSGWSVSYAGDVNGDDIDDIIIGTQHADPNGKASAGKSYVVFGIDCTPPTSSPTVSPTAAPTTPTEAPTNAPSNQPTESPTKEPTISPTKAPSQAPTVSPTKEPTKSPTESPTNAPTITPTQAPSKSPTESPTKGPTTSPTNAPTQSPTPYPLGLVSSRSIEQSIAYPFSVDETVSLINNHHEQDIEVRIVGAETDDENDLQLPAWIEPTSGWLTISPGQSEGTNMVFTLNSGNLLAGAGVIQHFVYFQWRFVNGGEDPPGEIIVDPNPLDVSLQIVTISITPTALNLGIALAVPSQGEAEAVEASTSMLNLATGTSAIWNATITCVHEFGNTDCSWFELIGDTEGNIDPSDPVPTQLRMKVSAGSSIADEDWGVQSSKGLRTHIEGLEPYKVVINVALEIEDNEGDDATSGGTNSTTTSTIIDIPVEVRPSAPCSPGTFSSSGDTRSVALCTSCPKDQYQPSYGSTTCFPCPSERSVTKGVGSTSLEKDCVEKPGDYRDESGNVRQCPEGTNCSDDQIGLTLTTLPLAKGYWRAGNRSIDIRKCPKPEFCIGGTKSLNSRGDGYCTDNHEGVYCLSCTRPYSKRRFDYGCVLCGADQTKRDALGFAISSMAMVAFAFLIIFIGVLSWRNYKNKNDNVADPRSFEQRQSNEQHDLNAHGESVTEVGSSGKHDTRNMPDDYDNEEGIIHPHTGAFEVRNPNTTTKQKGAAPGVGFLGETLETSRANAHKTSASSTEIITSQSRLVIGFFQVTDSIGRNFPLELPSSWVSAMESIGGVLALDLFGFLDIGCANKEIGGSHYMKLIGAIVGPVVAITFAVLGSVFGEVVAEGWKQLKQVTLSSNGDRHTLKSRVSQAAQQAREVFSFQEKAKGWFATMHMGLLFLIYPLVSLIILQTFSCETFDNGDSALIADYSIDCNSDTYQKYRNLAIFGVLLYPAGVPIYLASILFRNRHRLDEASNHDPRIRMLSEGYREGQVYFEIVEMIRKLLQTSIVVFILPGGATQIFSQTVITLLFLAVLSRSTPYVHRYDYFLAAFNQYALLMISIIALMNRLDVSELEEQRTGFNIQALLDWVLLLATVLPLIFCVGIVSVSMYGTTFSRFKVNIIVGVVGTIVLASLIGYVFASGVYAECAPGCATCGDAGSAESRCQRQLDTMENCGECGNNCDAAFPNAEGRCEMVKGTGAFTCPGASTTTESERGPFEFECKMTDCLDGFLDLNDDPSDGCEAEEV